MPKFEVVTCSVEKQRVTVEATDPFEADRLATGKEYSYDDAETVLSIATNLETGERTITFGEPQRAIEFCLKA